MVGDGANDLIAIKQANIGIGIQDTDAVYSSSFGVKKLSQVVTIVKEGKATERQLVEMVQYFVMVHFMTIIMMAIETQDAAFLMDIQIILRTFGLVVLMTIFMTFSPPTDTLSKYLSPSNFMGLENHLVFWGTAILIAGGYTLGYQLLYYSDEFVPNPNNKITFSEGWSG